ncbi:MAG: chemotaxis protein MotB [Calditrichaeota bacterium]|nr:chemotaxis protein MotB [Calditrichota bacterium]
MPDEYHAEGLPTEDAPRPRRRHKRHGHHGGAWKVAYADFVTAMLALFIVLWVLSQDPRIKLMVQAYFQDPTGFIKSGGAVMPIGQGTPPVGEEKSLQDALQRELEREANRLRDIIEESGLPKEITDQISFEVTEEGIRMEFRDAPQFSFFDVGSAMVRNEMERTIELLTPEIVRLQYPVAVEGHTDARAYGSGSYSNWELSADRAAAVRRVMLKHGLTPQMISEVRAYADTKLLPGKDPLAHENRRVSILLKRPLVTVGGKQ